MSARRMRRRLARCERGVTIVEFGLLSPVLLIMLMGSFDLAHTLYMKAALEGVVQKAARDATIQANNTPAGQAALDATVTTQVLHLNSGATVTPTRMFYKSYADAASIYEPFSDANNDGKCDNGEAYQDVNGNGVWDSQLGSTTGGAQDRILYTVTVSYPRLFPIASLVSAIVPMSPNVTLVAKTVLSVQPYQDQQNPDVASPATLHCS